MVASNIQFIQSVLKRGLIAIVLMFFSKEVFCQEIDSANMVKSKQLKINASIIGLSISYEKSISRNLTINYEAGLSYSFYVGGGALYGKRFGYELSPIFSIENRWYYNLNERYRKGKKITNNSGNFLSIKAGYRASPITSKNLYDNPALVIIPAWGIQRNIGKKISFELAPGYAFILDTQRNEWSKSINLSIKFGYILY